MSLEPKLNEADKSQPTPSATLFRSFVRRVSLNGITALLVQLRNLLLLPLLTRYLTPEVYGAWAQLLALIELLTSMASLSLQAALTRFLGGARTAEAISQGLWSVLVLVVATGTLLALGLTLAADWIATVLLDSEDRAGLVVLAAGLLPLTAAEKVGVAYFRARLQMGLYATLVLAESFGYIALAFVFVASGQGIGGVLWALIYTRITILLVVLSIAGYQVGIAAPKRAVIKEYLGFSLPLTLVALFAWATSFSDRYVLSYFSGVEAVGVYAVAYTLAGLVPAIFAPLFLVLNPTLAALWEEGNTQGVRDHLAYALKYALAVALPAVVGLTVLAEPIVLYVSGAEYFAGRILVGLTGFAFLLLMSSALFEPVVGLLRQTRFSAAVYGGGALVNMVLNLLLIPLWDAVGAALATCITYGLQLAVFVAYTRRQGLGFVVDLVFVLRSGAAALGMGAAILLIEVSGPIAVAGVCVGGAVLYATLFIGLGGLNRQERAFWCSCLVRSR